MVQMKCGEPQPSTAREMFTLSWRKAESPEIFRASLAVDENNTVYIGTKADDKSTFFAINSDGTLKWKNQLGADLYSSPALGKNGFVYVGSENLAEEKRLHALNDENGLLENAGSPRFHLSNSSHGRR